MSEPARIESVVFDYGGVLTNPVSSGISAWLEADGMAPESFRAVLKAWLSRSALGGNPIHRLASGALSVQEFEELLTPQLPTHGDRPVVASGILARIFAGMRADPSMFALVEELRALGIRVALLSNGWGNTSPRARIDSLFHEVVISGEVGLCKPDPTIYRLTLERLGITAEAAVFLDDAEPHVAGARGVGMHAWLHIDPAGMRDAMSRLVPGLRSVTQVEGVGA
ncbi:HAD family hydrolase [Streptomyces sp. HUAS ZL42]|uniref:HAD family hydrolase n=1 Tax=Streptomyces sp. HUAS ZL42 TaxID=3231715 RepID=UPI00345EFCC4